MVGPIRAGGLLEGVGNCLKHLKSGWNRKEGRGNKDFKKGGKLGQEMGALKKGGLNPFMNYGLASDFLIFIAEREGLYQQ